MTPFRVDSGGCLPRTHPGHEYWRSTDQNDDRYRVAQPIEELGGLGEDDPVAKQKHARNCHDVHKRRADNSNTWQICEIQHPDSCRENCCKRCIEKAHQRLGHDIAGTLAYNDHRKHRKQYRSCQHLQNNHIVLGGAVSGDRASQNHGESLLFRLHKPEWSLTGLI
jgi:hypothetical protein